jgi:hypothetical protein
MTLYVVRAKLEGELTADLKKELDSGKISKIRPFGEERSCSTAWRMQEYIHGMHTEWKKIIALRHLQWKGKVCLIAISKISQSSGLSQRKKGGIGSRTDPCFGSDIFYTSLFYLIEELLKNIVEDVGDGRKKQTKYGILDLEWERYNAL